jgi:hypothetical protein
LQILETQQQLMKVKAEEEQKTQAAGDARRWNGLKTMVEARALLKSLFKVATNQKAQVPPSDTHLLSAPPTHQVSLSFMVRLSTG